MTWALGGTEPFSWAIALEDSEPHAAESRQLVTEVDDAQIVASRGTCRKH